MDAPCIVCGHPSVTDINGTHLCHNHYDAVRERQGSVAAIVRQLRREWVTFVKAGLVEVA
jgi:hypothetical protein